MGKIEPAMCEARTCVADATHVDSKGDNLCKKHYEEFESIPQDCKEGEV